jgi:putative transposase
VSRYRFIKEHTNQFHVSPMCRALDVSASGYYSWHDRPESNRARENRLLLEKIRKAQKKGRGQYGSPRIYKELKAKGETCSRKRIARLMRKNAIRAKRKRKFVVTTDSKHDFKVAPNLLERNFHVVTPNRVWLSDITYIPTNEGWLYLAAVMDLCSKRIVGWSMSSSLERTIVLDALRMAHRSRRPSSGLIHHSDRGVQYASDDYQNLLKVYGMQPSMSRKGDCWDNAPMESFFASLKNELVHQRRFESRDQARREIFDYVEIFYNRERLHSSLGYVSPTQFEAATTRMAA